MVKNTLLKKTGFILISFIFCAISILLALPTINNNVDNPNMIVYFNADEGGLMDIVWSYYSGQRRESFQWDLEYGLEMLYLADFARLVLSHFMRFTPGTFVIILRWLHLFALILSFFALWHLIRYHFGNEWQPALGVILLAVRPAFDHFFNTMKPDLLVLLIIIIGLDYALRIIEKPSERRYFFMAIACASIAFLVKFAGFFLLAAIIASMHFARRYQKRVYNKTVFSEIKISWVLPSLIGLFLIIFPLTLICFYVRKSTGFTWYEQYGLWGSVAQNEIILAMHIIGLCLVFLSLLISLLNKNNNPLLKKIMSWINELNSHTLVVCSVFLGFVLLFGFRWIVNPKHFINLYAQYGPTTSASSAVLMMAEKGFLYSFFQNLINSILAIDPIIVFLFAFYLSIEIYHWNRNFKNNSLQLFKRLVLLIFIIPPLLFMFSMLRMQQRHILPFFVAISILAMQGFYIFINTFNIRRLFKITVAGSLSILFVIDISINTIGMVKSRVYQFHRHEDIAFDLAKWWRENIPTDAKIVSEHYIRVYVPYGYKNLKTSPWGPEERLTNLRKLVNTHHPQFIYYNKGRMGGMESMPPIEKILPDKKVRLVKSFSSAGRRYQRYPDDKFFIYEILE